MLADESKTLNQTTISTASREVPWEWIPTSKREKKIQHELHNLIDKYEEMARKMGASSSMDQLLTSTDLPYNAKVMAMPLPPKFRVAQMDMFDRSRDPSYTWKPSKLI